MLGSEILGIVTALQPDADRYSGSPQTDVISIKNADHVIFVLSEGVGGVGTCTLTVQACGDFTPLAACDMVFKYRMSIADDPEIHDQDWAAVTVAATGILLTAGANKIVVVEIDTDAIRAAGEKHTTPFSAVGVAMTLTVGNATAVDAGVVAILMGNRHQGPDVPSHVA